MFTILEGKGSTGRAQTGGQANKDDNDTRIFNTSKGLFEVTISGTKTCYVINKKPKFTYNMK